MNNLLNKDVHPQVSQLIERLLGEVPKNQAKAIEQFTKTYYAATPEQELESRKLEDLYGATLACWNFMQKRPETSKIRVFNPDFEEHGWQSTHTIVEVLHADVPFLVDSIRMELNRREMSIHFINNAVMHVDRTEKGELDLNSPLDHSDNPREAIVYVEIDRHSDEKTLKDLSQSLKEILDEICLVVSDFPTVKSRCEEAVGWVKDSKGPFTKKDVNESVAFLEWLLDDHFTFLGTVDISIEKSGDKTVSLKNKESETGLFKRALHGKSKVIIDDLSPGMQASIMAPQLISISKSGRRSRIHRPAYPDYITVKKVDKNGQVTGGRRFFGLFTSNVYTESSFNIPIVRRKTEQVIKRSGLNSGSHHNRELQHILEVYPRDELFHTDVDQLAKAAIGILNLQERRRTHVFIRHDQLNKFLSCLVYVPRDLYNTELRHKVQNILTDVFKPVDVEFTTYFSESILARTLFTLKLNQNDVIEYDEKRIQKDIQAVARSWQDDLMSALIEGVGEETGNKYFQLYRRAFGASYREEFTPRTAVVDIQHVMSMKSDEDVAMSLYRNVADTGSRFKFKLYNPENLLPLSDVIPILENLGLRVIGEHPYGIHRSDGKQFWVHDFSMIYTFSDNIDLHESKENFQEAFRAVWFGKAENDSFNRLLLGAKLGWREVALLRAYARYMKQIRFGFSESFIADTLCKYPDLASFIVRYFVTRFNLVKNTVDVRKKHLEKLDEQFAELLDQVESINEDRIFRRYIELIQATLRTNFFQHEENDELKQYFSFKFSPRKISDIPLPKPMFEIFVYSPRVEGVHLRGGKVARGGLRWSDRVEDFRTEVLGLVKAQQVKNSVIVPVGAKGGFIAKQLPEGDRDAFLAEGIECYKTFISGLLDITDNLMDGEVIPPEKVIRFDQDDPYLVVAADKGTATFSDISNGIAQERGFWLGDAFASGGSVGYDHKKMGITAKGAWVSVQRHFRELGLNVQKESISVIGVGDMAGDVFGNGMLRSEYIKLVAAFNHLHIFIDPNPEDVIASFKERQRLFDLPRSAWTDYESTLISKGGGVFNRSAKSIDITPEMKACFNLTADRMSPNDLIHSLLKAPVDLIWNGGIGTYVKSSSESHNDAGDKANDSLRIDGKELNAKVIGEGGNLGITQRARIEYALSGSGASFTDFIDNAAGVDCSDHEVNIKILLNGLVQAGDLTIKQRNELLESMTDEVSTLVLLNNYRQTQAIALAYREAKTRMDEYKRLMNDLEKQKKLNRELEFLPNDEELEERKSQKKGLTRPELSVLISYTKGDLKELLNTPEISQDTYLARSVESAFPNTLLERFPEALYDHQLRSEIVATQLANEMVNRMGITYVNRMRDSTGSDINAIVKAYVAARDVFRLSELWEQIEALDYKISSDIQESMMASLMRLVRRASRWFLRNRRRELNIAEEVERFRDRAASINSKLSELLAGEGQKVWQDHYQELINAQVPEELAATVAGANNMFSALSIIEGAEQTDRSPEDVAATYYQVGCNLDLEWFLEQLNKVSVQSHWQALARETYRDDLDWQQRTLTASIIKTLPDGDIEARMNAWLIKSEPMIGRWRKTVEELQESDINDFAVFSVALRELLDLAQASRLATECD
ncbi:NAD-glutamate dehydrogenase GdhB [Oceaniserpentilla sp. 4NH20-0058]|uniref:NAD-glutamate dehydrogenase n=1 Tax=Oceaniserpentilla sp. 4NH20-0058 TaxID=3127660 RepID=UPI0031064AE2